MNIKQQGGNAMKEKGRLENSLNSLWKMQQQTLFLSILLASFRQWAKGTSNRPIYQKLMGRKMTNHIFKTTEHYTAINFTSK